MADSTSYACAFCMLLFVISINCEVTNENNGGIFDSIVYTGTNWCGTKAIANNDDDLGEKEKEDLCCRAHHKCSGEIKIGETKYNITNNSDFVIKHCDCEKELRDCLKKAGTWSAKAIGSLYFNAVTRKCFTYSKLLDCTARRSTNERCYDYKLNPNEKSQWQQIDVPQFGDNFKFYLNEEIHIPNFCFNEEIVTASLKRLTSLVCP